MRPPNPVDDRATLYSAFPHLVVQGVGSWLPIPPKIAYASVLGGILDVGFGELPFPDVGE